MQPVCPEISDLEALALGRLPDELAHGIAGHVSACHSCRERLAEIEPNLRLADSLRRVVSSRRASHGQPPSQVGGFRIVRELGRGGMGTVYAAEQQHPKRLVAIKILDAGRAAEPDSARLFRREIDALGRLKHPGIAAIYDAGWMEDGRPYLVMELVEGEPLREYVERKQLPLRARVQLFQRIAAAVAYAHQRGVIHRDLKPGNVLVVSEGGGATPKLLDFGLAKLLDPSAGGAMTFETEVGRIAGTLPYMSPEQVRGDAGAIDVRSDVYSLGVMLYELLTGRLPYALDRRQLVESARTICEVAPARPGTIDDSLRGDLETILLKSLEKDPDRRYGSVAALADDLERYLADAPIQARPATLRYQLGKLIRRHRAASAAAAVALLVLIAFGAGMSALYARANAEARRAERAEQAALRDAERAQREAATANRVRDLLVQMFDVARPEVAQGRTISARDLADWAADRLERQVAADPLIHASLSETLGLLYRKLGLPEKSKTLLARALALRREHQPPDALEIGRNAAELANTLRDLHDWDSAEAHLRLALGVVTRQLGEDNWHSASLLSALADVASERGDHAGAEQTLRRYLVILRQTPHGQTAVKACVNRLAGALEAQGKHDEAIVLMRELLAAERHRVSPDEAAALENNLAWLLLQTGELSEAARMAEAGLATRRRILPPEHPAIGSSLTVLGAILLQRGDLAAAEELLREATVIRRQAWPGGSQPLGDTLGFLGESIERQGRIEEAEPLLLEAYRMLNGSSGDESRSTRGAAERLARLYARAGRTLDVEHFRAIADGRALSTAPARR